MRSDRIKRSCTYSLRSTVYNAYIKFEFFWRWAALLPQQECAAWWSNFTLPRPSSNHHAVTISNAKHAVLVAYAHFIVANCGAAITNLVYARPGLGILFLGSHNFDTVTDQKELWFKTFFYDSSTMPANANWENYSIPALEYNQQFWEAFDFVFSEIKITAYSI